MQSFDFEQVRKLEGLSIQKGIWNSEGGVGGVVNVRNVVLYAPWLIVVVGFGVHPFSEFVKAFGAEMAACRCG